MAFKFYLVQKEGVPAVWQSEPEQLERLLKHKAGYLVISETPSNTRAEALTKLRQLFPEARRTKSA